jgi:tetratricopeptide (TPR) repeat protein
MRTTGAIFVMAAMTAIGTSAATPGNWSASLDEAQRHFYSGRYESAAALAFEVRTENPDSLAASELRTSALHFQMRRALGEPKNREDAWKQCAACQELMPVFMAELAVGQAAARARLEKNPADEEALFFLGKLDLNYVWLQLGTVGRKTGWGEYWEARKSLDAVLKTNPGHVRALVARAWIDYIVDTKLPRGTKWMLGGGDRKKGLATVQEAAQSASEPFVQAEARFGLWDMQVRERKMADAVVTARALARDFPDNQDLAKFLAAHESRANFTNAAVR